MTQYTALQYDFQGECMYNNYCSQGFSFSFFFFPYIIPRAAYDFQAITFLLEMAVLYCECFISVESSSANCDVAVQFQR